MNTDTTAITGGGKGGGGKGGGPGGGEGGGPGGGKGGGKGGGPGGQPPPNDSSEILQRAIDGVGTNPDYEDWGAVDQHLLRLAPAAYEDGIGEMVADRPGAREISNAVVAQAGDMPNALGASDFLWAWGQFIDHDLDLTEAGTLEFAPISVPTGDAWFDPDGDGDAFIPFFRVDYADGTGVDGAREHVNEITAFMDASMVYGSDAATAAALRGEGGTLLLDGDGLLIQTADGVLAGDVRAAENAALTSMHTLFAREHNWWVSELAAEDTSLTDDELYLAARMRVEAEIQAITHTEFLPIIIGEDAIAKYRGYDETVNPGISVEFSTAAFRFGHSLLSSELQRLNEDGSPISAGALALRDAFFNADIIGDNGGIDPLLRGLAAGTSQELDAHIVDDVRNFLFGAPGDGGLDLASLNIQRGRDLGVASYNDLREALGLGRAEDFSDITSDTVLAQQLEAVYGDVDLVDAWVGGLAEDAVNGGMVGEVFATVIADQFQRLRDGDPYWSEAGGLSDEEVATLWDTSLGDVIERNTDIDAIQDQVFFAFDRMGGTNGDDAIVGDGNRDLLLGLAGNDTLEGNGGDDQLEGDAGSDLIIGGAGNDTLKGGADGDIFVFAKGSGMDIVTDFEAGDMVKLEQVGRRFDLDTALKQVGDAVELKIGGSDKVLFENTTLDQLTPDVFDIA
ncbi:MAG: peroxidase family protein [Pseudomonadota bacterium]